MGVKSTSLEQSIDHQIAILQNENVSDAEVGITSREEAKVLAKEKKEQQDLLSKSLVYFAELGELEALKKAIADGAKVSAAIVSGSSALMRAIARGHVEVIDYLLTFKEAALPKIRRDLSSPVTSCFLKDDVETLKKILAILPTAVEDTQVWGLDKEHRYLMALNYKAPKCAAFLLENHKDVVFTSPRGRRISSHALWTALDRRDIESSRVILEKFTQIETHLREMQKLGKKPSGHISGGDYIKEFVSRLLNKDDPFTTLMIYRHMHDLINSCAELRVNPLDTVMGDALECLDGLEAFKETTENGKIHPLRIALKNRRTTDTVSLLYHCIRRQAFKSVSALLEIETFQKEAKKLIELQKSGSKLPFLGYVYLDTTVRNKMEKIGCLPDPICEGLTPAHILFLDPLTYSFTVKQSDQLRRVSDLVFKQDPYQLMNAFDMLRHLLALGKPRNLISVKAKVEKNISTMERAFLSTGIKKSRPSVNKTAKASVRL